MARVPALYVSSIVLAVAACSSSEGADSAADGSASGGTPGGGGGSATGGQGGSVGGTGGATGGSAGTAGGAAGGVGGIPPTGGGAGLPIDAGGGAQSDAASPRDAATTDGATPVPSCLGIEGLACPNGVTVGLATASSPALGGTGGSGFDLTCSPGRVLTGVDVRYTTGATGEIQQLQPECSSMAITAASDGGGLVFHTTDPTSLAITGTTTSGTYATDRCPTDEIVVAMVARIVGGEVRRFGFVCGAVSVTPKTGGDGWELTVGPGTSASPERGRTAGPVTTLYTCPSGSAGAALTGRSGVRINQVQLHCAPIDVPFPCAGDGGPVCAADKISVPVTHQMTVAEGGTVSLTCSSGTIASYSSLYGGTCAGTCPVDCGTCTMGNASCSNTYNNGNCGDCDLGCNKSGDLTITCQ